MGAAQLLVRDSGCWTWERRWRVRDAMHKLSARKAVHDWLAGSSDARDCPAPACGCTTLASSVVIAHRELLVALLHTPEAQQQQ
ncbi:hypothetical protein PSPO01_11275 [Paraphaeosphaeria sporulosa]